MLHGSLNPLLLLLLLPYTLHCFEVIPRPEFGAEVLGVNLNTVTKETILELEKAVIEHRWVLFRGQNVSRERHVEITTWLGPMDETSKEANKRYYGRHGVFEGKTCEHEDVMTMSNDNDEGLLKIGVRALHCDATYKPLPIHYCLWHMENASRGGNTMFVDLVRTLNEAPESMVERWEQMSFTLKSNKVTHPLVFTHPCARKRSMLLNLAMIRAVVFNNNTQYEYEATKTETQRILYELQQQLHSNDKMYEHAWQDGDFVISDNLAVVHRATEATQFPRSEVGLRRLHRTSTGSERPARKNYTVSVTASQHSYYQDESLPVIDLHLDSDPAVVDDGRPIKSTDANEKKQNVGDEHKTRSRNEL